MYPDPASTSARLWEQARAVMPGGSTRHTIFFPPYPIYAERGEGCRVWDVDGVARIDCVNNYSSLIHGHSHPKIVEAVTRQIARLTAVGLPTKSEIDLAQLICGRVASIDAVRFVNSGTEATMLALKIAHAFTERPVIAKIEGAFHGSGDDVEVSLAPSPKAWGDAAAPASVAHCRGVPDGVTRNTLVLPLNDVAATRALIRANAGKLAAVLIDPLISRLGFIPLSAPFLAMLREETEKAGILLIFDEVFSFRLAHGGAQSRVGITPDLTTLGKIIGGGFPVGAVGGRREIMAVLDQTLGAPPVNHGGTFNANPVTMTAGLVSMELLTPAAFDHLARLGERLREGLRAAIATRRVAAQVKGDGSLAALILSDAAIGSYRDIVQARVNPLRMQALHRGLLNRGVLIAAQGGFVLSTAMTNNDVDQVIAAADETLGDLPA